MDIFTYLCGKTNFASVRIMKNILVRSLSGTVYVGLIIASIVWGGYWAYPVLCAFLAAAGIIEFNRICLGTPTLPGRKFLLAMDVAAPVCGILGLVFGILSPHRFPMLYMALFFLSFLYLIARPVAQLFFSSLEPARCLTTSFGGNVYIALPLLCSCFIQQFYGPGILLALFIMIWCNDTGAFLTGITLGRHKLWERISPKKTWEGFFGGMIFCTAAAVACYSLFSGSLAFSAHMKPWGIIVLGITVSIVATWGDLVESMLKRAAHVKDSGHIIPGHGGVLDRIDSLLLVMPWALLWLMFINWF